MSSVAAVDVGGTFTDFAVWDEGSGLIRVHKQLTSPADPTRAIVDGLAEMTVRPDVLIHGTTLVTNALIERRGACTGLITTDGYRDVLEIGAELRYDIFDLFLTRPEPLVPRPLRRSVPGRVGADGVPVLELDRAAVMDAAQFLVEQGVEAIAVAFLNSYRNPGHEAQAAAIVREHFPDLVVSCSADVAPEIREYERFSTAVANAYVQPLVSQYLGRLAERVGSRVFVMLSDGGITTARDAAERPITLIESGPAAGSMVAAHLATESDWPEVIAFDMGGTTAKISLIHGGVPQRTHDLEAARVHRFKKGSGLPLRLPVVQLIEIGAGGGSIAWTDSLGLLKVGPRSSGAAPGPACYGLGGQEPTVTDADLHLGYLSPDAFLGGRMRLDTDAADTSLEGLAARLGIRRTAAAAGIADVVNNNMATAARVHIAEQGRDQRRYRLIAFGGAGPVHAYGVARLLHMSEVVFPRAAGIASAVGMLVAPRSVEYTRSLISPVDRLDWNAVEALIDELSARATSVHLEADVPQENVRIEISADLRYVGQGYEITIPLARQLMNDRDNASLRRAFEEGYLRQFNRSLGDLPAEVVSWRVRASSAPVVTRLRFEGEDRHLAEHALLGERLAYFPELGRFTPTKVFLRDRLHPGDQLNGPVIVQERESATVLGPSGTLTMDMRNNLVMHLDRVAEHT
ncbi:MAG: methylhydantoinase [Candidatus Dormiibacter spiritus]|nr:MAG: methylhydantoinase [Candidatus Dormibacteraeota bacterium]